MYSLKRPASRSSTPDGKKLALPTNAEFQQVDLR